METITLKMEKEMVKEIDSKLKENRYSTRTEFIRDAVRHKLSQMEKELIFKRLEQAKGSLKGKAKSNMSDEEAGELAFKEIATKFGIKLD
jgi:Arc/MetJ-type ribon-helix-helix transcriptional regulator